MSTLLPFRDKRLPPVPAAASMYHHDPLLHLGRQTNHIQQNLQVLIDAQSEGLLSGLGQSGPGGDLDDSFTPTSSITGRSQSPSTVPARQPPVKKISLRAARRGIFQSIFDLLKLREEEREVLLSQANERSNALREIAGFTSRRGGLEEAISTLQRDRESQRAKQLQEEARTLETDIHELETRLYEMKARHKHLVSEISNISNSVDAKLSSYTESLSLLQSDIRNYLRDPPIQPSSHRAAESTFYSLNPKRRTLEMAQEHWQQEQERLQKRQQAVEAEIIALEEGGGVWKQVMSDVSDFEKRLRVHMRRYVQLEAQEQSGAQVREPKEQLALSVAEDLEQTTQRLESQLEHAEDKDWKLLVCCIAAELEALREARGMLLPAFGLPVESDAAVAQSSSPDHETPEEHGNTQAETLGNDDPDPPADLLKDGDAHHADTDNASRSEDDEPDPAWLLPES